MARILASVALLLTLISAPVAARETVTASEPEKVTITVYRDPNRREGQEMNREWPRGIAMISETRTVTLPAGESTIRFDGVAEGMVAVSAIVTGLPGGTIEKNRNADLLSPASLLDGTLGNRVQITRTNPATGAGQSETAIVRTRADGGLVLQTQSGFEAVRCSGLPERLTFDRLPTGLSAKPVFTIDTRDPAGGTYQVTLTYIAWGFDWQAHYVATLADTGAKGGIDLSLLSWLTILNDNGQSFPDAELLAVAGTINITSNFQALSDPPTARPMRLMCYPIGSTAAGSAIPADGRPRPVSSPIGVSELSDTIVVTARRREESFQGSPMPIAVMTAEEAQQEELGDLKLYRIPKPVDVAAQSLKQVAFLNKDRVRGAYLYRAVCEPSWRFNTDEDNLDLNPAMLLLTMKNEEEKGLGVPLPMGGLTLFEPSSSGTHLVGELDMRDYAVGQDIELELGDSTQVFSQCARVNGEGPLDGGRKWTKMRAQVTNANNHPIQVRVVLGSPTRFDVRWPRQRTRLKNGNTVVEVTVPANSTREYDWKIRLTGV